MRVRTQLALALGAAAAASALLAGAAFVQLQASALRRAEAEKTRLLLDGAERAARESLLADDPLILSDHLAFLRRDRPEVRHCRVRLGGTWRDVGAAPPKPAGTHRRQVRVSVEAGGRTREAQAEIWLSPAVLEERRREGLRATLRDTARAGALAAAAGILLSVFLAHAVTRRVVAIEAALTAIGEGRFGASVEPGGADEIARLGRGVNAMSARLKELDEMKRTFVASVTHELHSPLGAIESHVSDLLAGHEPLGPETRESLGLIRRGAQRLGHFVASMLELSRIERGKLDLAPVPSDPRALVADVVDFFAPRAREAGLSLDAELAPGLGTLTLDPGLVGQVLTNLVSNALKFTRPGGRVTVGCRPWGGGGAEFSVEDTGCGIPASALGRVFAPFERVPNPVKTGGAGLGLAIAKSVVELHGGDISAESREGEGSRFSFRLPAKPT